MQQKQERSEAERRATTCPAAGFDEGQPGGAQKSPEGERPSHTTSSFDIGCYNTNGHRIDRASNYTSFGINFFGSQIYTILYHIHILPITVM